MQYVNVTTYFVTYCIRNIMTYTTRSQDYYLSFSEIKQLVSSDALKARALEEGGGGDPNLPTCGECSNSTDYSILNKCMHTLYVN